MKDQLAVSFNRYCVECKKQKSTHALLWIGIYVCAGCAANAQEMLGGQTAVYAKDVMKEHWDDYQLRSLAYGGNKPYFDVIKEFDIGT